MKQCQYLDSNVIQAVAEGARAASRRASVLRRSAICKIRVKRFGQVWVQLLV